MSESSWLPIESVPKDKWIYVQAMVETESYSDHYEYISNEFQHYIFVAKLDSNYNIWEVNVNTCGCCPRKIKPIKWMPIPK